MVAPKKRTSFQSKTGTKRKSTVRKKSSQPFLIRSKIIFIAILLVLLSPFYYGYVLRLFSTCLHWIKDYGYHPHYHLYKGFHIPIPDKYSIHGIDVSFYQGQIDWQMVKRMHEDSVHITFAYIKATEGIAQVDPYFQRNWREAAKAGIICGPYHYFRPEKNGKWQARFLLQNVNPETGDLPIAVDIEELDGVSPEKMRAELTQFLKYISAHSESKPIIYAGLKFYKQNLAGYFNNYTFWLAHYYEESLDGDHGVKWVFWQHNDKGRVNGINHVVDFDAFNGDSIAFKKLLIKK